MASRTFALAALGLAAALAGCAHEKTASTGFQWAYVSDDAAEPRLAYGRPSSDDVAMMIRCRPGRDQVDFAVAGLGDAQLVLASGRTESRFEAARVEDPLSGGLLEASGQASAAALTGFRKSGDLELLTNGQRHSLAATSADREQVRAFFKACEA